MIDEIYIPIENIIAEGRTDTPKYAGHRYVIFWDTLYETPRICICAEEFYRTGENTMWLCTHYISQLCRTMAEYKKMTEDQIDRAAYFAYMTGAR